MDKRPLDLMLFAAVKGAWALDARRKAVAPFDPEDIKRILVVSSTSLGDTMLSTPAIKAVRRRYPQARVVGFFRDKYVDLFRKDPHLDAVISYRGGYKRFFKTLRALRRERFDLVLIFHGNGPQAIPMAYFSGAPYIFRLPAGSEYGFLLDNRGSTVDYWAFHAIEGRLQTAALAGCDREDIRMVLEVGETERARMGKWLGEKGVRPGERLIGFQIGAADPYKVWPATRFAELGARLLEADPAHKILLLGTRAEGPEAGEIAASWPGDRVLDSTGQVSISVLPALVERLALLVTNDTGTLHLAVALERPTVSLFVPTSPKGTGPIQDPDLHRVIQKDPPCVPCVTKKCPEPFCMDLIETEEVFQAALSQLAIKEPVAENRGTR